jgi:hypothetical protein
VCLGCTCTPAGVDRSRYITILFLIDIPRLKIVKLSHIYSIVTN